MRRAMDIALLLDHVPLGIERDPAHDLPLAGLNIIVLLRPARSKTPLSFISSRYHKHLKTCQDGVIRGPGQVCLVVLA